ncbi:bis(5'-nucleosyl)-tetraphosphatase (symmetrical) YqeK [Lachnospiraceae bacterium LCP25S3_G4]
MSEFLKLKQIVQHELDDKRYEHTIGVMYTAASLAMCYGYDIKDAMIAGLLHDCAKCIPTTETLRICNENNIVLSDIEQINHGLIHAKLGAYLAKERYGITNSDILHAIKYHTTGCPEMTLLDKIIFISDYIEPNRTRIENLDIIRKLAYTNIDKALFKILSSTLEYLNETNRPIDKMTELTYEYYKDIMIV